MKCIFHGICFLPVSVALISKSREDNYWKWIDRYLNKTGQVGSARVLKRCCPLVLVSQCCGLRKSMSIPKVRSFEILGVQHLILYKKVCFFSGPKSRLSPISPSCVFPRSTAPNPEMTVSEHWSTSSIENDCKLKRIVSTGCDAGSRELGLADRTRKTHPALLADFYQYTHASNTVWLAELSYTVNYW